MDSELLLTDKELHEVDSKLGKDFYDAEDAEAWLIDRRGIAKAQLAKVSAAGFVQLDENQELPLRHQLYLIGPGKLYYGSGYAEAQQDMLAAGFMKVKGQPPKERK